MQLIRPLDLAAMQSNIQLKVEHVPGIENEIAYSLSRFQFHRFRRLAPKSFKGSRENLFDDLELNFKSEVLRLAHNSVSLNTVSVNQRGLDSYTKFRDKFSLKHVWPILVTELLYYLAYMSKMGYAYATVRCLIKCSALL
jgi:hypothetical protein